MASLLTTWEELCTRETFQTPASSGTVSVFRRHRTFFGRGIHCPRLSHFMANKKPMFRTCQWLRCANLQDLCVLWGRVQSQTRGSGLNGASKTAPVTSGAYANPWFRGAECFRHKASKGSDLCSEPRRSEALGASGRASCFCGSLLQVERHCGKEAPLIELEKSQASCSLAGFRSS